jgi:hypothetical protein
MPFDADTNIDMPTTRELAGATSFVPFNVSEAYRGDAYNPKSIVSAPEILAADDKNCGCDDGDGCDCETCEEKENVKSLKEYFASPTYNVIRLIGNKKYVGNMNGEYNIEICKLAADLERSISQIIGEDVSGLVLMDNPKVIESTIDMVVRYKDAQESKANSTLDERFYQLSKILMGQK